MCLKKIGQNHADPIFITCKDSSNQVQDKKIIQLFVIMHIVDRFVIAVNNKINVFLCRNLIIYW